MALSCGATKFCAGLAAGLLLGWGGVSAWGQSPSPCIAQGPARQNQWPIGANRGAAALGVALEQLHTRASLLMMTAHPDDEDGAALAYEARAAGAKVSLLTLNRGEGGANIMSSDLWDALGLVRTEELLQADRYYCATQYFTSAADYGFSKSLEEAMQKWGGPNGHVFYDVVRAVRTIRPLVVASVFVGGPSDGHGNHQAAGMWAQKVFLAAGNPNVFPDQIKAGLLPWNPLKEYGRVPFSLEQGHVSPKGLYDYATHNWRPAGVQNYITGKWEPGAVAANVEIPDGTYITAAGASAQQISRAGLGFQKSQNGGPMIPLAGPQPSAYHRFGSRVPAKDHEDSFFDGIDISLPGIATLAGKQEHGFLTSGLDKLNGLVEQAIGSYSAKDPSGIAPELAQGLALTDSLIQQVQSSNLSSEAKYNIVHELTTKKMQFNNALALSLGLSMSTYVTQEQQPAGPFARFMRIEPTFQMAIPGQHFPVAVHVAEASPVAVQIDNISLHLHGANASDIQSKGTTSGRLDGDGVMDSRFEVEIPESAGYTQPYFSRPSIEQAYYDVNIPQDHNLPESPYPLLAQVTATYQNAQIHISQIVQTVQQEVGYGMVFNPMPIAPAISVSMVQADAITPLDRTSFPVSVRIHSNAKGPAQGNVRLDMPAGWSSEPASQSFSLKADGQEQIVSFVVHPEHLAEQVYHLTAVASYDNKDYSSGYVQVGYPGLRPYFEYSKADYQTTGTDVKVGKDLQVAYIEGSGDDVPASLENLGIHVHFLAPEDLASADLSKYNLILVGIRAYAVRPDLRTYNGRILDYVKNGGTVVVQYQTPEFDHNFGPYPYKMTSDPEEVTDENSPMTFDEPSSPVLNWPNKITSKDFNGWIEERGSKFLESWAPQYQAPIETHDPGQAPQKGGLVVARYGSGVWVYTAYAFYRELPLGVPGAYRIFANLISIPQNPSYHNNE